MSRNTGRKMNKRARMENSVQAYACVCACNCVCSCGLFYGGAVNVAMNKLSGQVTTDTSTKALN